MADKIEITTPVFRINYSHLLQPSSFSDDQAKKYSFKMLFEKDVNLGDMRKACEKALLAQFNGTIPKNYHDPIKSGDDINADRAAEGKKPIDSYAGRTVISASSQFPIELFSRVSNGNGGWSYVKMARQGAEGFEWNNPAESIYDGCYCVAKLVVRGYSSGINKGVTFYPSMILKVKDGPSLGSSQDPESAFAGIKFDIDVADVESIPF
jgi:hypothetical protein